MRLEVVSLDPMIAPRGDQQRPEVVCGEVLRLIRYDAAGGLAGAGDHAQRAGQLAVPGGERMQALAAIAEPVAVVAAFDDVEQPAGGRESGSLSTAKSWPKWSNAMWNGFQNPVAIRSSFVPSGRHR